jgi:hypothetical protein
MQKDQDRIGNTPTVGIIIARARDARVPHSFHSLPSLHPFLPRPLAPTLLTMNSFSDGPSRQNPLDFPLHSSSPHDMRQHLQNLLDGKEKQLQQAAALGESLLAQRVELEGRVRLLQEVDADKSDEITADMRERYRELADTVRAWELGNVQLTSTFTSSVRILVLRTVSPPTDRFVTCFAFLGLLWSCASTSIAVIDPLLSRFRISMVPSHPSLLSTMKLYEMNPNDRSLRLVLLLLSLAERKMLLTVPMTLVRIAIQHPQTHTDSHAYNSKSRVCVRDWQRSSNRGQAPSEFARRARQGHTRHERGEG